MTVALSLITFIAATASAALAALATASVTTAATSTAQSLLGRGFCVSCSGSLPTFRRAITADSRSMLPCRWRRNELQQSIDIRSCRKNIRRNSFASSPSNSMIWYLQSSKVSSDPQYQEDIPEQIAAERRRRERINAILAEDDRQWQEERRREMEEELRRKERKEEEDQRIMKVLAEEHAERGFTLTTLDRDVLVNNEKSDLDEVGSGGRWHAANGEKCANVPKSPSVEPSKGPASWQKHNGTSRFKKKKDSQQGALVGSAGGWSLEVFPGDFVVHRKYGIGKFEKTVVVDKVVREGTREYKLQQRRRQMIVEAAKNKGWSLSQIQKLIETFGTERDKDLISRPRSTMLEVAYADGIVHVPIDKAYRLSRFRAGEAAVKPKLSRIRGDTWKKAKEKVAISTTQLAQEVLALYATRETLVRPPFDPLLEPTIQVFGDSFPYEPTPDQRSCFEDIENDMVWRRRPMDRLVCGDVGFGKTEVALRALYRCVANGRQAVLLAPTGVLAAQHYKTILHRMGPDTTFDVSIAMLRGGMGKNTRVGKEIRSKIKSGEIQLIVGTHALLSRGVPYNNIGLLVVDEEQRFGVKQKERLKLISDGIDVLTLSATPIPRTLQMSLSGIRDTSTIRSPPPMRKPVISIVERFSESLVYEAIERELARDGQCFYVVPRISMLDEARECILRLFPDASVATAHGQMGQGKAEANVEAFAEGKHDVLLATTVIENGVDIPNVNTIVIQNSQSYGMSTLYQLRGRVGRSSVQAYAYFLHQDAGLTEQAVARLQAMAELHQLGSGFDVAARDLEIRGAGSLLGTEQSGMAERVGFDLYMRMLKKSIRQLRGLDLPTVPRTNILLPGGEGALKVTSAVDAQGRSIGESGISSSSASFPGSFFAIPPSYIEEKVERAKEESAARLAENTDKLVELAKVWRKKYGPIPASLKSQMKKLHLHASTRLLGVDLVGLVKSDGCHVDAVLRSPGLRPRHWAKICSYLPHGVAPKGVHAFFPGRFTGTGEDLRIYGGNRIDRKRLELAGMDRSSSKSSSSSMLPFIELEDEDEEWDALDEEEEEAIKEITSAAYARSIHDVEIDDYPRIVVARLGDAVPKGKRVDKLLRALLPVASIVSRMQVEDRERAVVAMDLQKKREAMKKARKAGQIEEAFRNDYFY